MFMNPQKTPKDAEERDPETGVILGAAVEVHKMLGIGFLEAVYQEAIAWEFQRRGIPFSREVELTIISKRRRPASTYRADFICFNSIIVELKAPGSPGTIKTARFLNDLEATGFSRALSLNFGKTILDFRRLVLTPECAVSASCVSSADLNI